MADLLAELMAAAQRVQGCIGKLQRDLAQQGLELAALRSENAELRRLHEADAETVAEYRELAREARVEVSQLKRQLTLARRFMADSGIAGRVASALAGDQADDSCDTPGGACASADAAGETPGGASAPEGLQDAGAPTEMADGTSALQDADALGEVSRRLGRKRSQAGCDVAWCEEPHYSKGLCKPHAKRLAKYGDALLYKERNAQGQWEQRRETGAGTYDVVAPAGLRLCDVPCAVEWCDHPAVALDLCETHRLRVKQHGDALLTKRLVGKVWRLCREVAAGQFEVVE